MGYRVMVTEVGEVVDFAAANQWDWLEGAPMRRAVFDTLEAADKWCADNLVDYFRWHDVPGRYGFVVEPVGPSFAG